MTTIYRRPTHADIGAVVRLAETMHNETSFHSLSFSVSKTAQEVVSCILSPTMFFEVAEKDGELVGMVAAYLSSPYFSDDPVVYDHVWYVAPVARGTMVGPKLLKHVTDWAGQMGAKAAFVTLGSDVSQERVGKLVEKLGYSRLGGYYRKDIDRG